MTVPPLYPHQKDDLNFLQQTPRALNYSDCGTGKTRTTLEILRHALTPGERALILAPKSILQPAWGNDLDQFTPELIYSIAYAKNREAAFRSESQVIITNHDACAWLVANSNYLKHFNYLVVDEASAFRNSSQRTQALIKLRNRFDRRLLMTGTPYVNSLQDLWRPAYICDDGQRLGKSFYAYRGEMCEPYTLPNGITLWRDKPGMEKVAFELLRDITIRHRLKDCTNIPPNRTINLRFELSATHRRAYEQLLKHSILEFTSGNVSAQNALVLRTKLLQLLSGAVYDDFGQYKLIASDRYELVAQRTSESPQNIVAFLWQHQKDQLKRLIPGSEVIDGRTPVLRRNELVQEFQNGQIGTLLVHPKTGAHGLTLTAGHETIWASPTYNAEDFKQLNHRIYRNRQTKATNTVLVEAKNTVEQDVFLKLQGKLTNATDFLLLFCSPNATELQPDE